MIASEIWSRNESSGILAWRLGAACAEFGIADGVEEASDVGRFFAPSL